MNIMLPSVFVSTNPGCRSLLADPPVGYLLVKLYARARGETRLTLVNLNCRNNRWQ